MTDFTPEQRKDRLRDLADKMLIAMEELSAPKTVQEIEKQIRLGLLIERLYTRCDVVVKPKNETKTAINETEFESAFQDALAALSKVDKDLPILKELAPQGVARKPYPKSRARL